MILSVYQNVVTVIRNHKGLSKHCFSELQKRFPDIDSDTLYSILSSEYQKRMKVNHIKTPAVKDKYWNLYKQGIEDGESPGIVLRVAENYDVAPCLVAKLIIQKYFEQSEESEDKNNVNANIYLRDTTLLPDMHLAYEAYLCTIYDNIYSPLTDLMKTCLGRQYEIKLYDEATELGLAYRDEEYLRKNGYDKTPDCKLEIPIAIDGFLVNWIESKALFGDEDNHKEYIRNQYLSYWNRFGPGLVIYWFGFLETIVEPQDKRFIIRNHLPKDIIQYTDLIMSQNQTE